MQYYQTLIHTHRPWMSKRHIQPQPPQGAGHMHAQKTCIESAIAIAKLLHLYETQYTFRCMSIQAVSLTFSAALMLVFATVCNRRDQFQRDNEISTHLSVCFRALEELGPSWESARRAQSFLVNLQRLWAARMRSYYSSKRVISQSRSTSQSRSGPKRTRTTDILDLGEDSVLWEELHARCSPTGSGSGGYNMDSDIIDELDWMWTAST